MRKQEVHTPADALVYLLDCQLATVCDLALRKSRSRYQYSRQIDIAQRTLDWVLSFGLSTKGTRGQYIVEAGITVKQWAKRCEP